MTPCFLASALGGQVQLGITAKEDPQVGTVWHRNVIDEIINGRVFERLSEEIVAGADELKNAVYDSFKILSKKGVDNILNESTSARYFVRNKVLEIMNGRGSPNAALEAVLLYAKSYEGPFVAED